MSAICGVVNLDGRPVTRGLITSMTDALAHRGPDGRGVWLAEDGSAALGHLALHTTPESPREAQPVERREWGLTLVADARIDNREELIGALGLPREPIPTDAELIAAAYERWGDGCANRLIGDFAFAIWDARAQTLFCARDPLGVKPFYYFLDRRQFVLATEVKALLVVPGVDARIDPEQVALFLGWHEEDRSRTVYSKLLRLPAAHTLLLSRQRSQLRRYWTAATAPDIRFSTENEYIEAFREVFASAISARMRCSDRVGATLSGGLDSSSIVCMARRLRGAAAPPLPTFSLIFPDLPEKELRLIDERSFVDAVVRGGGLDPTYVRGDHASPLGDLERILWHVDEPFSTPNLYLHWAMYGAAADGNVRVLLDGFDGDSAVSHGFGRLTGLARAGRYDVLSEEVRAFSNSHGKSTRLLLDEYVLPHFSNLGRHGQLRVWWRGLGEVSEHFGLSRGRVAARSAIAAIIPDALRARRSRAPGTQEYSLLKPKLARSLRRNQRLTARSERLHRARSERDLHVDGISQPLYQLALEIANKSAAAFEVEPRYPFFDRRLVEFCVGLPDEQKFAAGWPRYLFRRAMEGILPPEIQWRTTKGNLSPNFHRQLREVDVRQRPIGRAEVLSSYARVDRLMTLRRLYESSRAPEQMKVEGLALFRVAVLEAWLVRLIDPTRRQTPAEMLSSAA